eukprot:SAG25_NODE_4431_length_816_cov_0.852162_2_plen_93_part_00
MSQAVSILSSLRDSAWYLDTPSLLWFNTYFLRRILPSLAVPVWALVAVVQAAIVRRVGSRILPLLCVSCGPMDIGARVSQTSARASPSNPNC